MEKTYFGSTHAYVGDFSVLCVEQCPHILASTYHVSGWDTKVMSSSIGTSFTEFLFYVTYGCPEEHVQLDRVGI